jgi:peptidoglycan hydrolase-like protein with peptidoglycan-binding domain
MNRTNNKIFAMCLAATMVVSITNFTTRTLAVETTKPTVQSISNNVTNNVPSVTRLLRINSKGNDVKLLQTNLNKYGYKLIADGIFGRLTLAAVKNYQSENSLNIDGIVGPATGAKLIPISAAATTITIARLLKLGSAGSDVKLLQTSLNKYGYKLIADGIFGKLTLAAVKNYQSENSLSVDGLVGPLTIVKLKVNSVEVVSVKKNNNR